MTPRASSNEDRELVSLVNAVLVDPDVPTDLRMRLQDEIATILAREHQAARPGAALRSDAGEHLSELLDAVLVDPNLHTDARMRIHRQIHELLDGTARGGSG